MAKSDLNSAWETYIFAPNYRPNTLEKVESEYTPSGNRTLIIYDKLISFIIIKVSLDSDRLIILPATKLTKHFT